MSQSFEASWWEILLESFVAFRYDEVNFLIQINSSFIFVSGMKNYESPENSRKEFICKNVYLKKEKTKLADALEWKLIWANESLQTWNWWFKSHSCFHSTEEIKINLISVGKWQHCNYTLHLIVFALFQVWLVCFLIRSSHHTMFLYNGFNGTWLVN